MNNLEQVLISASDKSEFIDIVNRLEPTDVAVLMVVHKGEEGRAVCPALYVHPHTLSSLELAGVIATATWIAADNATECSNTDH